MTIATGPGGQVADRPADRRRPSLVVSALSNWAAAAVGIAAGFVLTPFVIARLGPSGHGVWVIVGAILLPLGLLELGVPAAVNRQVAYHCARGDYAAANRAAGTALVFFLVCGAAIMAFAALVAGPLAGFFNVGPERIGQFRTVIVVLAGAVALNLVGQVYRAAMLGHERFLARNLIAIASHVVRAALTIVLLLAEHGLIGLAVASLAADLMVLLVCVAYVRLRLPGMRVRPGDARWGEFWPLVAFGLTTFVIAGADVIRGQLNVAVAGRMLGLAAVSVYGVAFLLLGYYSKIIFSGFGVLTPRLSALAGLGNRRQAERLLIRSLWTCSVLSGIGAVLLLAIGPDFIRVWVRKSGYELAPALLVITAAAAYFELAQYPATQALYAANRHRVLALARVVEGAMNIALSILLVPRLGLIGVAIGMAGPMLLFSALIQPVYIARLLGLPVGRYVVPVFATAAVGGLLVMGWHGLLSELMPRGSYLALTISGTAIAAVCLLIAWAAMMLRRRVAA